MVLSECLPSTQTDIEMAISSVPSPNFTPKTGESEVANFYADRSILVTGATGYLGKCLVFRLLNECPDIKVIYLLIRGKGQYTFEQRKERFLNYDVFDYLQDKTVLNRLCFVEGDVGKEWLGISEDLRPTILNQVSIIFHSAASVSLDTGYEPLVRAANCNIRGTVNVLNMGRCMTNLACLVYVSTATVYPFTDVMEEKIHPISLTAERFLEMIESNDKKKIDDLLKSQQHFPNPYTLSKGLSENLCQAENGNMPICIVRPPIISNSVQSPVPGWTYKMQAFNSLVLLWVMGLCRCLVCDLDTVIYASPVDYVCNVMIVSAFSTARSRKKGTSSGDVPVYNIVSSSHNHITWQKLVNFCSPFVRDAPSIKALRWPTKNPITPLEPLRFIYSIVFEHIIFAIFMDFLLIITGNRPQVVSLMLKIYRTMKSVKWNLVKKWNYVNKNYVSLNDILSEEDKKKFPLSMHDIEWMDYIRKSYAGIRKFVLYEDDSQIKPAIARLRRITILTNISATFAILMALFIPTMFFLI